MQKKKKKKKKKKITIMDWNLFGMQPWTIYSEIPLLRPPKIKASYLLKILFAKLKLLFSSFSTHSVTTFGTVQKWSLRPLLDSPKSGLNIEILLYLTK